MDEIAPSMQQVLSVLFPYGEEDHIRQLDELTNHFDGRYDGQKIDNNLIFVLSLFLISPRGAKNLDTALTKLLSRPNNVMSRSDAEYLCLFAIANHPKLEVLLAVAEYERQTSKGGGSYDMLPNANGEFGYSITNPIPTKGITGIYDYLSRLRDSRGNEIQYERLGSRYNNISDHPIDVYDIVHLDGTKKTLYFSGYHLSTSRKAPANFKLYDLAGNLLDNGICQTQVDELASFIYNDCEFTNIRTIADQAKAWNASKVYPVLSKKEGVIRTFADGTPKMFLTDGQKEHLIVISKSICQKINSKESLPKLEIANVTDLATGEMVPTLYEASLNPLSKQ